MVKLSKDINLKSLKFEIIRDKKVIIEKQSKKMAARLPFLILPLTEARKTPLVKKTKRIA